jgi:multiple RNA-binding domain-containing protein 1
VEENIQTMKKASTWNTLFLSSDAVAEVLSERFKIKKSDLIADTNATDSIAVRMALGETQIVNETKKFLEDHGINLKAFSESGSNKKTKQTRSKTVILVKNLPVGIEGALLHNLFSRYGSVIKVILPVHGVTAVVEMQEEVEAKKAFDGLINYKLNHIPVYLEWAPIDVFGHRNHPDSSQKDSSKEVEESDANTEKITPDDKGNEEEKVEHEEKAKVSESKPESGSNDDGFCLFVKNVSFNTTDASFEEHFSSMGKLISAKISRKKGSNLSNGYGFVIYAKEKTAEKALRQLQNSRLDDHMLQIERSVKQPPKRKLVETEICPAKPIVKPDDKKSDSSNKTTKILVRNVPFEANAKEVSQIFSAFGGVKSVRMPKKMVAATASGRSMSQSHRGFAFVDFVTRSMAEKAFESLSGSTHLYGRRLNLEWAKQEDSSHDDLNEESDPYPNQKTSLAGGEKKRLKKSDLVTRLNHEQDKKMGVSDFDDLR